MLVTDDDDEEPAGETHEAPPAPEETTSEAPPAPGKTTSEAPPAPKKTTSEAAPAPKKTTSEAAPAPERTTSEAAPAPKKTTSEAPPAPKRTKRKPARQVSALQLSAQEERLWGILRDTNREWTPKEVTSAFLKLKAIGIESVRDLMEMLELGKIAELNKRLKANGKRPFAQKTMRALWSRVVSELPPERFLACAAQVNAALAEAAAAAGEDACEAFASGVAVRAVSSTAGPRWACESCLWENVSSTFICAACDTRRASLTPWLCMICKRENEASALKCRTCLETRQRAWAPMQSSICDGFVFASGPEVIHEAETVEDGAPAAEDTEESDVEHTHYELIGVAPDASLHEISLAYHKQRREIAKSGREGGVNQKKLASLREAYKVLTDQTKRRNYDLDHDIALRPTLTFRPEARFQPWASDLDDVELPDLQEQQRSSPRSPAKPDFHASAGAGAAQPPPFPSPQRKAAASTPRGSPGSREAASPKAASPLGVGVQDSGDDLYGLLGVQPTASMEQILMAFQEKLAQQGPAAHMQRSDMARLELLNKALDVLTDPAKRQRYDDSRRSPRAPESAKPLRVVAAASPVPAFPFGALASPAPAPAPAPAAAVQQRAAEPKDLSEFDLYELLGVAPTAGLNEILPAFQRRLTDGSYDGDPQKLALLNQALDVMTNSEKRLKYDAAHTARKVAEAKAARAARRAAIVARASVSSAAPAAGLAAPAPAAQPATAVAAPAAAAPAGAAKDQGADLYDLLGLTPAAGLQEILVAFQQRLTTETDANRLALLKTAFDVLTDTEKRREYDSTRSAAAPPAKAPAVDVPTRRVVVARPGAVEATPAPSSPSRPARSSGAVTSAPARAEVAASEASEPRGQADPLYSPRSGKPRIRPRVEPGAARPGQSPTPSGPPPWECPDCQHDNPGAEVLCGMCGTKRGSDTVAAGPPWWCQGCSIDNPTDSARCSNCGGPRNR